MSFGTIRPSIAIVENLAAKVSAVMILFDVGEGPSPPTIRLLAEKIVGRRRLDKLWCRWWLELMLLFRLPGDLK